MQTPEDQNNNIRDDGRVIAPSPFDEMRPAHQAVASETVDSVEAPRRARVDDAVEQPEERRKDYL